MLDVDEAVNTARRQGIAQFVVNGCCEDDWPTVSKLAELYHGIVLPQFGLHPWWVGLRTSAWLVRLRAALQANPGSGLGECGLDKGPRAPPDVEFTVQLEVFEAQLRLAEELRRPVSVHCVKAFGAVHQSIVKTAVTSVPIVLHAWTGSAEMTERMLQLGNVYFSLNGQLTRVAPAKAIRMVRLVPLERLLLESDAPDGRITLSDEWIQALPSLAPVCKQLNEGEGVHGSGGATSPEIVRYTLAIVATILGKPHAEVADASRHNARRIFQFLSPG